MSRKFSPVTPLRNMTEVIQSAKWRGSHFFDPDTMRYFQSRLAPDVYPTKFGTFFITSEKDRPFYWEGRNTAAYNGLRRYTVRFIACRKVWHRAHDYTYIANRGELVDVFPDQFGQFGSLNSARKAAKAERDRLNSLRIGDRPVLFDTTQAPLPPDTERADYKSDIQFGPWPLAAMPADAIDREFWGMADRS